VGGGGIYPEIYEFQVRLNENYKKPKETISDIDGSVSSIL
jgi:hypothetical protein